MSAVLASAQPEAELFIVLNVGSGAQDKRGVADAIQAELDAAGRRYRFVPVEPGQD